MAESSPETAPSGIPSRWGRRRLIVVAAVVAVVVVAVLALAYLPLESTASAKTISTSRSSCGGQVPCPVGAAEFAVGDGRYARLTGAWESNASLGGIIVTINNGPSSQACAVCSDMLYTSIASNSSAPLSGSFDVSGFGPFHVSVDPIGIGSQTTNFQITIDSAVI